MKKLTFLIILFILLTTPIFARSGCCSHHQGVCGCGCCDGSPLSAICAPYYPECNGGGIEYSVPTQVPYIPPTDIIYTTESTVLITDTMYEPTIGIEPQEADSSRNSTEKDVVNMSSVLILAGAGYLIYRARKK